MVSLFPDSTRPNGEENGPFNVRVNYILEQMEELQATNEHRPSVIFSLTTGRAHKATAEINLCNETMDLLLESVKSIVIYDKYVQGRRVTQWMNVTYHKFRRKEDKVELLL